MFLHNICSTEHSTHSPFWHLYSIIVKAFVQQSSIWMAFVQLPHLYTLTTLKQHLRGIVMAHICYFTANAMSSQSSCSTQHFQSFPAANEDTHQEDYIVNTISMLAHPYHPATLPPLPCLMHTIHLLPSLPQHNGEIMAQKHYPSEHPYHSSFSSSKENNCKKQILQGRRMDGACEGQQHSSKKGNLGDPLGVEGKC